MDSFFTARNASDMGKRGDQLVRVFDEAVEPVFIQHCSKIANSVVRIAISSLPRSSSRSFSGFEFAARSGKHEHGIVIREVAIQDGLKDVVDHTLMIANDGPDIDPLDGAAQSNILFLFFPEVIGQGALQAGSRRDQHQSVDVEPAVTEDYRSGCLVPLVDR